MSEDKNTELQKMYENLAKNLEQGTVFNEIAMPGVKPSHVKHDEIDTK